MYEFLDHVDWRWLDISIVVAHKGQYDGYDKPDILGRQVTCRSIIL